MAIERSHHGLVRRGSRFWIVRPRFEGLTRGVEGLDTLLRNPYVVFDTPEDGDLEPVQAGTLLVGLSAAPADHELPPLGSGDRLYTVQFARSYGLDAGAPVLLRDIRVGEVRSVELDTSGQWSSVLIAVRARYGQTVRTNTVFWVQKPSVQSGWLASNIRASELGSLLTGPSLAFHTPEGPGEPLQGGAVVRGRLEPPELPDEVTGPIVYVAPKNSGEAERLTQAAQNAAPALAGLTYTFEEEGLLSNRRYVREGTALLVRGPGGRTYAVTSRSLCDGGYVVSDTFSRADVTGEQWRLRGAAGWSSVARRVWTAPSGADLAVLELQAEGAGQGVERGELAGGPVAGQGLQLVAFRGERGPEFVVLPAQAVAAARKPGVHMLERDYGKGLERWEGAVALDGHGRVVGLVGRTGPLSTDAAVIGLQLLKAWEAPDASGAAGAPAR
jgi:hypothetical protein